MNKREARIIALELSCRAVNETIGSAELVPESKTHDKDYDKVKRELRSIYYLLWDKLDRIR